MLIFTPYRSDILNPGGSYPDWWFPKRAKCFTSLRTRGRKGDPTGQMHGKVELPFPEKKCINFGLVIYNGSCSMPLFDEVCVVGGW